MRLFMFVVCCFLTPIAFCGDSFAEDLKQALAKVDADQLKDLELNRKSLRDAYLAVGKRDVNWDTPALEALELAAFFFAYDDKRTTQATLKIKDLTKQCLDAGCQDGLIQYLFARTADLSGGEQAEVIRKHFEQSAERMRDAKYPVERQYAGWSRAFAKLQQMSPKPVPMPSRLIFKKYLDEMLALTNDFVASPTNTRANTYSSCKELLQQVRWTAVERRAAYEKVFSKLPKSFVEGPIGLCVKGDMLNKYAWDARGTDWAANVTADGWKKMKERLTESRQALEKSYELDPTFEPTCTAMLTVELGDSRGREAMELWYKRARKANVKKYDPCNAKMHWLHPKWHGSGEEMLQFGRELVKEGLWETGIPYGLVDAHRELALHGREGAERFKYYLTPGVWEDLKSVFEPYLERYPEADWYRNRYAFSAGLCEKWDVVRDQLNILKDRVDVDAFETQELLDTFRKKAGVATPQK